MKQVEETRGLVLQSAQREFLDKGYEKASLRSIAQNAGVTTGALYVRFPNKSALFAALVEPVSAHLLGLFRTGNDQGFEQLDEGRPEDMWSTSEDVITRIVDYIFEHKEPFDLLINHAAGSGYEHFLDDLVEEEVSQSLAYLDAMRERGLACAVPRRPPCARERGILRILRNRSPRHLERGRRCAHQTHRRLLPPRLGEPLRRVMPSFHDH